MAGAVGAVGPGHGADSVKQENCGGWPATGAGVDWLKYHQLIQGRGAGAARRGRATLTDRGYDTNKRTLKINYNSIKNK